MEKDICQFLLEPKQIKVGDLCQDNFSLIIPSYQRGYRWTEKEVLRLVEDVFQYDEKKDGSFYCLQPLVVRHIVNDKNHRWRVIDGQQRLTTIFLILKAMEYDCYSLSYERENILSEMYNKQFDEDSSCEIWYLSQARKAIEKWIEKNQNNKEILKTNILEHCRFILYVMQEDEGMSEKSLDRLEHDLFNNLNSGKISLTESELIKALFLHKLSEVKAVKEIKQISMSEELDFIERTLRKDEMWYFLAGNRDKPSSCIDYLYKVWYLSQYEKIPQDIDYPIFSSLEECISSDLEMFEKWDSIKKCFYTITGWYDDPLLYNLIGYLEGRKCPKFFPKDYPPFYEYLLAKLYKFATKETENHKLPTRKEFIDYVKKLCSSSIPKDYHEARFDKDKNVVFNILLLLNIAMLVNNKSTSLKQDNVKSTGKGSETKISRFPFHVFHTVKWNVEHISPQNPRDNSTLLDRLRDLKDEYQDKGLPEDIEKLYKKLNDADVGNNLSSLVYDGEYISLRSKFVAENDNAMLLGNLTLLTEHDNKGIGNRFYFDKRNKLNSYQAQGSFIPTATINVFSKWYTSAPDGFIFWDAKDQADYQVAIKDTINDFINFCDGYGA